jgi:GWxTD domain-containing protein
MAGLMLAAPVSLPARAVKSSDLKEWARGPIRYITTAEEAKVFAQLKDNNSRISFIERFWTKRDPTPATLVNETRQLFWERVRTANSMFTDSSGPGWKTDRGKIYILNGPPTEIREDLDANTGGLPTATRGLIRWIYEGRPAGRPTADAVTVVAFVRDASGEYRISYEPRLTSVFFDWQSARERSTRPWDTWMDKFMPPTRSDLAVMLDQGSLQEVPSQEEVLLDRVVTYEAYSTQPLALRLDRYDSQTEPGNVLVILRVLLHGAGSGNTPAVIARFAPVDATLRTRTLAEGSFQIAPSEGDRVVEGRVTLEPGTWSVTVLAADPEGRDNGLYRGTVVIPPRTSALRLSDIVLASLLEPVRYASLASYDEPFYIGAFRVISRIGRPITVGEPVQLFYQIYGGTAPYRVEYRLEGREDDGRWTPLGQPVVNDDAEGAQGWSLPTTPRWPLGSYRVHVGVRDAAGVETSALVPFDLVGETKP